MFKKNCKVEYNMTSFNDIKCEGVVRVIGEKKIWVEPVIINNKKIKNADMICVSKKNVTKFL